MRDECCRVTVLSSARQATDGSNDLHFFPKVTRTFWQRDISGGPGRPSGWGLRQAWMYCHEAAGSPFDSWAAGCSDSNRRANQPSNCSSGRSTAGRSYYASGRTTARKFDQPNENKNERGLCRCWPNKLAPEFREGMLVDPAHQVSVVKPCCSRVSTVPFEQGWFYTREWEMSRIQVRLQAAGIRVHYGLVKSY